jgi:hypothetical protein
MHAHSGAQRLLGRLRVRLEEYIFFRGTREARTDLRFLNREAIIASHHSMYAACGLLTRAASYVSGATRHVGLVAVVDNAKNGVVVAWRPSKRMAI